MRSEESFNLDDYEFIDSCIFHGVVSEDDGEEVAALAQESMSEFLTEAGVKTGDIIILLRKIPKD